MLNHPRTSRSKLRVEAELGVGAIFDPQPVKGAGIRILASCNFGWRVKFEATSDYELIYRRLRLSLRDSGTPNALDLLYIHLLAIARWYEVVS